MVIFRSGGLIVLLMAFATSALAQVESTPFPLGRKPDFSMFMTGTYNCSTQSSRRPAPYYTTNTSSVSQDGYWLVTQIVIHKTSWMPRMISGGDRITYDPSTSRWIDMNYDDAGGYGASISPGWRGNSIVWTDALTPKQNNIGSTRPATWTRVSATKMTQSSSLKEAGGRVITVKTTCTKA
jgi:hypothetical protein